MIGKVASSVFRLVPESGIKNAVRAVLYRIQYNEYKTYYRNKIWELHYPGFVIKYHEVPSPASTNYLFFKKFVHRDYDIIIDAGGFMGTYGFLMASKYPAAKVYIFEADPENYKRILDNLALNNLPNVIVEPLGLWDKTDKLRMSVGSDLASSVVNEKVHNTFVDISVVSMDEYFKDAKDKLVFIKMNIESAEVAALNGARNFLTGNKVELAVSTDHYIDGKLTQPMVAKIFDELHLQHETIKEGIYINTFAGNISN